MKALIIGDREVDDFSYIKSMAEVFPDLRVWPHCSSLSRLNEEFQKYGINIERILDKNKRKIVKLDNEEIIRHGLRRIGLSLVRGVNKRINERRKKDFIEGYALASYGLCKLGNKVKS